MSDKDWVDGEIVHMNLTKDALSTIKWKMKDGTTILVKDMEDRHIRNCALFLMGMGYQKCIASQEKCIAWLTVFRMEWERRTLAKKSGIRKWTVYNDNAPIERYAEDEWNMIGMREHDNDR